MTCPPSNTTSLQYLPVSTDLMMMAVPGSIGVPGAPLPELEPLSTGVMTNCSVVLAPVQLAFEVYMGLLSLFTARQPPPLLPMLMGCKAGIEGPGSSNVTSVLPVALVKVTGAVVLVVLGEVLDRGTPL
jgi:hypothetical protein